LKTFIYLFVHTQTIFYSSVHDDDRLLVVGGLFLAGNRFCQSESCNFVLIIDKFTIKVQFLSSLKKYQNKAFAHRIVLNTKNIIIVGGKH